VGLLSFQIGFSFVWRIEVGLDFRRTVGGKDKAPGVEEVRGFEGFMQHSDLVVSHCTYRSGIVIFFIPPSTVQCITGGGECLDIRFAGRRGMGDRWGEEEKQKE